MFAFHAIIVVLSVAIFQTTLAGYMPLRPCPDEVTTGNLEALIIPSCDEPPCILRRGRKYTVEIDFDVAKDKNTTSLLVEVFGIINGIEVPWPGVKSNGCEDMLIGDCPLFEYDYVTYGVTLDILILYPNINLDIKWKMSDERGDPIWCFMLEATITG